MKYPLSRWNWFCREVTCYFVGHKWLHSKLQKTKYFDIDEQQVPYEYRKTTGNYMWESLAWWDWKCTRCRLKLRRNESEQYPWHIIVAKSIRQFWSFVGTAYSIIFEKRNMSLWKKLTVGTIGAFTFGFTQAWFSWLVYEMDFPALPGMLVGDVEEYVWELLEE